MPSRRERGWLVACYFAAVCGWSTAGFTALLWASGAGRLYALIAALMVIMGTVNWLHAARLRRALSRHASGRCRVCGYDLRATPERCPECGAVTK